MSARVLHGDCLEVLRTLPAESVQCVVTSPPYWGLRDYGVEGQIGLERTPEQYVAKLVEVFREVRRVLRADGTVWLNLGDSYCADVRKGRAHMGNGKNSAHNVWNDRKPAGLKHKDLVGIPWRVAFALQADGWYLRSEIVWAKPNPMPESVTDRPTSAHEKVFLLTKSPRYFYDAEAVRESFSTDPSENYPARARITGRGDQGYTTERGDSPDRGKSGGFPPNGAGRNLRNVWTIPSAPFPEAHFATFPPRLAELCIRAGTSEKGRCPECGAPWPRVVEREFEPQSDVSPERGVRCAAGQKAMDASNGWGGFPRGTTRAQTAGFHPTCACSEHVPTPCTVLDLFGGAGTTGLVADRLGRDCILIELSPAYVEMMRERIRNDAPLFGSVA